MSMFRGCIRIIKVVISELKDITTLAPVKAVVQFMTQFHKSNNDLTKKKANFRMQEAIRSCGLQMPVFAAVFSTG